MNNALRPIRKAAWVPCARNSTSVSDSSGAKLVLSAARNGLSYATPSTLPSCPASQTDAVRRKPVAISSGNSTRTVR